MQNHQQCSAADLGLKSIASAAGHLPQTSTPNEVTWRITLYAHPTRPEMLAASLTINHSYTVPGRVATRRVALAGRRHGEWLEFQFPNSKEGFKVHVGNDNSIEIVQMNAGAEKRFTLSPTEEINELVVYGESCQQWQNSLATGKWSPQLWQE